MSKVLPVIVPHPDPAAGLVDLATLLDTLRRRAEEALHLAESIRAATPRPAREVERERPKLGP